MTAASADGNFPPVRVVNMLKTRVPDPADHVALRALLKYMSAVLGIPYKSIASGTKFDESSVKNYANDKSSRSARAAEMHVAFVERCAQILAGIRREESLDDYVVYILKRLLGEQWLKEANIELPVALSKESLDDLLANWLGVSLEETNEVEQRYCGLWTVIRASSFPRPENNRWEVKEISHSLLNIRPRSISDGPLCDFRWYSLGRGWERDERRVIEGYIVPNVDRIEFLGRVSTRHKLLTLMVWRFASTPEVDGHARVASGVSLSLNTSGGPVAARMRAFFIENSDRLEGEEFSLLKTKCLKEIGVKPMEVLSSLIPAEHVERTLTSLAEYKPIVGFLPAQEEGD
jgi:hypothetical protein